MLPQTAQLVTPPHFCEEKKCYSTNYLISVVTTVLPPTPRAVFGFGPIQQGGSRIRGSQEWCKWGVVLSPLHPTHAKYKPRLQGDLLSPTRLHCRLFMLLHLTVNNINIQNSIWKAFWTQPGPLIKSTEEPEQGCTALRGASFFSEPLSFQNLWSSFHF